MRHRTKGSRQTKRLRGDEEGQVLVTTMVNYTTAKTWWQPANGRDADKEKDSGTNSTVPQPEDA